MFSRIRLMVSFIGREVVTLFVVVVARVLGLRFEIFGISCILRRRGGLVRDGGMRALRICGRMGWRGRGRSSLRLNVIYDRGCSFGGPSLRSSSMSLLNTQV